MQTFSRSSPTGEVARISSLFVSSLSRDFWVFIFDPLHDSESVRFAAPSALAKVAQSWLAALVTFWLEGGVLDDWTQSIPKLHARTSRAVGCAAT